MNKITNENRQLLNSSAAWRNFETKAQAGVRARDIKLISTADFARADDNAAI